MTTEQKNRDLEEITTILRWAGEMFHGGRIDELAREWLDCGFTPDNVQGWVDIGCWDPSTADSWSDLDLTPDDVERAAEGLDWDEDVKGCDAIYAACNGDLPTDVFID